MSIVSVYCVYCKCLLQVSIVSVSCIRCALSLRACIQCVLSSRARIQCVLSCGRVFNVCFHCGRVFNVCFHCGRVFNVRIHVTFEENPCPFKRWRQSEAKPARPSQAQPDPPKPRNCRSLQTVCKSGPKRSILDTFQASCLGDHLRSVLDGVG